VPFALKQAGAEGRASMESSARHLDPRVRIIWLIPTSIIIAIAWVAATALSIISPATVSGLPLGLSPFLFPIALLIVLLLVLGLPTFAWVHMNYVNFTYELAAEEIIIREGVFTRKRTVIPYARIQNISTERTVLERALGIATLNIETAGSNPGISEGILPGIASYEKVIGEIMGKVERSRSPHGGVGEMSYEGAPREEYAANAEILHEIRETNRLLREMLRERHEHERREHPLDRPGEGQNSRKHTRAE